MRVLAIALLAGCITDDRVQEALDRDRDGYITANASDGDDCDDRDASVHPGATEVCADGKDNDCDGVTDDAGAGDTAWYRDSDGDGFGDASTELRACAAPSGYVEAAGDCDDDSADIHPGKADGCDGVDSDCDGVPDDDGGTLGSRWYADADGDGHGDAASSTVACAAPAGYVAAATDCDDTNASVHPDAPEACNQADDDCDGAEDEGLPVGTWYVDADGDGYGSSTGAVSGCAQPGGTVTNDDDCDDGNAAAHPGASDTWYDGVDQNCDGRNDYDKDGDGHGTADHGGGDDCDDEDARRHPGAIDACGDGFDADCEGVDLGCRLSGSIIAHAAASTTLTGAVAIAGDPSGDGVADLLALTQSAARLYYGPLSGVHTFTDADVTFSEAVTGAAINGDANGDGVDDVLLGTGSEILLTLGGNLPQTLTAAAADAKITPQAPFDSIGYFAFFVPDSSPANRSDIVINGYSASGTEILVFANTPSGTLGTGNADARIDGGAEAVGELLAPGGKVTGKSSFFALVSPAAPHLYIMSAPYSSGQAASKGIKISSSLEAIRSFPSAGFDVDGDGSEDMVVGGAYQSNASKVGAYLLHGPITGPRSIDAADLFIAAPTGVPDFSWSSGGGDFDGDGIDDLVIAAPQTSGGQAYLFHGDPGTGTILAADADAVISGGSGAQLGTMISAADTDGDGYEDLILSAPGIDKVYVIAGSGD